MHVCYVCMRTGVFFAFLSMLYFLNSFQESAITLMFCFYSEGKDSSRFPLKIKFENFTQAYNVFCSSLSPFFSPQFVPYSLP